MTKLYCGFPARTWSQTVAGLQIASNICLFVFGILGYLVEAGIFAHKIPYMYSKIEKEHAQVVLILTIVLGVAIIFISAFGIALGVILYEGIIEKNWRRLRVWILCSIGCMFLNLVLFIQGVAREGNTGHAVVFALGTLLQILSLFIVHKHKEELKKEEQVWKSVGAVPASMNGRYETSV